MSVTVVLPTVGDTPKLRSSVENMLRTTARAGPDSEVLVVVNGRSSVPALDHIGSTRLRVLHLDQRNGSKARNVGIEAARHDTVLFGDDGAAVVTD